MYDDKKQRIAEDLWMQSMQQASSDDISIGCVESANKLLRFVDINGLYETLSKVLQAIPRKRRLRDCSEDELAALMIAMQNAAFMQAE